MLVCLWTHTPVPALQVIPTAPAFTTTSFRTRGSALLKIAERPLEQSARSAVKTSMNAPAGRVRTEGGVVIRAQTRAYYWMRSGALVPQDTRAVAWVGIAPSTWTSATAPRAKTAAPASTRGRILRSPSPHTSVDAQLAGPRLIAQRM